MANNGFVYDFKKLFMKFKKVPVARDHINYSDFYVPLVEKR